MTTRPPLRRMQIILAVLRAGKLVNASELAEQLEVSTKAIHHDIDYLRNQLGFEIEYDGSIYGYRLGSGKCPFCSFAKNELGQFYFPRQAGVSYFGRGNRKS